MVEGFTMAADPAVVDEELVAGFLVPELLVLALVFDLTLLLWSMVGIGLAGSSLGRLLVLLSLYILDPVSL